MKKFLFLLCLILITVPVFALEYEAPLTGYNDSYILAGTSDKTDNNDAYNDQIKFYLSLKCNVFFPAKTGIYLGYSQLTHWLVYGGRDTMYTQYQPEVFYRFESGNNIFNNYVIPYVDYIQISPEYHCSTGVEGANHRSVNEYYGKIQMSVGDVYNFGFNTRVFGYYSKSNRNEDINDYKKNYEADVFFKYRSASSSLLDKEEIHVKFGGNPLDKGFICGQVIFRILTTYVQPRIMLEYYKGYDEFMTTYNVKETSYRAGLVF